MFPFSLAGARLAPVSTAGMNLIAIGNSYVAGFDSTGTNTGNNFLQQSVLHGPLLSSGLTWTNQGVGSRTITDFGNGNALIPHLSDVYGVLVAGKLNVILLWEGINETATNGQDGTAAFTAYGTVYSAIKAHCRANGFRSHIVLLTSIPVWYGSVSNPSDQPTINNHNTAMLTMNALIRAQPRGVVCDSYMDIAAINGFDSGAGKAFPDYLIAEFQASSLYSQIDLIHPIDAGHALIGTAVGNAFNQCRRYA